MHAPTKNHWSAVKLILQYLHGTVEHGMLIRRSSGSTLQEMLDWVWDSDVSTFHEGDLLTILVLTFYWGPLVNNLGIRSSSTPILWCDNLGATYMSANPIFRACTKHVEIDYHFVQEKVAQGHLLVKQMAAAAQNTNNTSIRSILQHEKLSGPNFTNWYRNLRIVLRDLENYKAYDMIQELKTIFEEQAKQELFEILKAFHACKQEDGQSVSSYLLKMKSYLDTLERLVYAMSNKLSVSLILNSLNKDDDQFIQNYNMHSMGNTIAKLHAMLKLHEKGISKKSKTPVVLAIRKGKIQKDKQKPRGVKGKDKGKTKLAYAPKPKIPPLPKRDNLA
ncbi:zinc finger, CCHC-type containing protein [Tanacetum coccineum]